MMVLAALAGAYGSMTFNGDVSAAAADDPFMVAIDIAEELVSEGVPFRQAHEQVGQLVAEAVNTGRSFRDVVADHSDFNRFLDLFGPGVALARRRSPGSSGPQSAGAQQQLLSAARTRAEDRLTDGNEVSSEDVAGPFL
jgi:argininosuccinate lyase